MNVITVKNPLFGKRALGWVVTVFLTALNAGCSLNDMAVRKMADVLAEGGTVFASDEDPDLIEAALPFSLKLMESLLEDIPDHPGLLLATSSGFAQFAYAFVQEEADELEDADFAASSAMRARAARLYLRARNYGLRGLELRHVDFEEALRSDAKTAVSRTTAEEVPFLYWTAASWAGAISMSKDNPDLIAELPIVEALIDRALELNESFDSGAIHNFLITYEMIRTGGKGNPATRARGHLRRAEELSGGKSAGPYVAFAESVSLREQNLEEFQSLLADALAVDPNAKPEWRLVNLIMQRRARWLLSRIDELFLLPENPEP